MMWPPLGGLTVTDMFCPRLKPLFTVSDPDPLLFIPLTPTQLRVVLFARVRPAFAPSAEEVKKIGLVGEVLDVVSVPDPLTTRLEPELSATVCGAVMLILLVTVPLARFIAKLRFAVLPVGKLIL